MSLIAERLQLVQQRISSACADCQRQPSEVALLAVSKTKPIAEIEAAYAQGQRQFGENYVQEGAEKILALERLSDIEWHFIGPLQSNKTKLVAAHFDWMHSLDRLKIAMRLAEQRGFHQAPLNVLIQVNIDDETSKAGISADDLLPFAEQVSAYSRLSLRGLMTIPKANQTPTKARESLLEMQQLFKQLAQVHPQVDTLSMGMSADLELAISCGATMVRIGTDIFGQRV